jgi:hypothetical protein
VLVGEPSEAGGDGPLVAGGDAGTDVPGDVGPMGVDAGKDGRAVTGRSDGVGSKVAPAGLCEGA